MGGDSGGVRAIRIWAQDVVARADLLIPFTEVPWRSRFPTMSEPGIQDRTIGELTRLEALLQPGDTERHAVVARLGTLLALRYSRRGRRSRRGPQAGAAVHARGSRSRTEGARLGTAVCRRRAAGGAVPESGLGGRDGKLPDHAAFMDWCLKDGASLDVAELPELFTDVQALPMPPELRQVIDQAVPALALLKEMLRPGGVAKVTGEQVSSVLPDDFPWADQVRMVNWVRARVRDQPRTSDEEPRAEQSEAARAESERRKRARILSSMEAVTPGFISPDALRRMNEELERDPAHSRARPDDRALEALPRVLQEALAAVRNSDPDQLDVALDHMADALGLLPQGHELAGVMEVLRSVLVGGGDANGGNLQDAELGHQLLESLRQRFTASETSPPWHLTVLVRLLSAQSRLERAQHAEDLAELDGVIDELLSLRDIASRDDDLSVNVLMALAEAYQARGAVRGDGSDRLRMFECLEKIEQLEDFSPALKEPIGHLVSLIRIQRGMDENDPELIREGLSVLQPTTVLRSEAESRSARGLLALYHQTKDPSALDQAIAGFERISERIRQGEEATLAGSVLWNLAEAYACRSDRTEDPADLDAAIATALDSLHSVASDVLLQSGAEHGLLAARKGANAGSWSRVGLPRAATWRRRSRRWSGAGRLCSRPPRPPREYPNCCGLVGSGSLPTPGAGCLPRRRASRADNSPAACAAARWKRSATGAMTIGGSSSASRRSRNSATRQRRPTTTRWSTWYRGTRKIRVSPSSWCRGSGRRRSWCRCPGRGAGRWPHTWKRPRPDPGTRPRRPKLSGRTHSDSSATGPGPR